MRTALPRHWHGRVWQLHFIKVLKKSCEELRQIELAASMDTRHSTDFKACSAPYPGLLAIGAVIFGISMKS